MNLFTYPQFQCRSRLALSGHYTPLLLALGALSALGVSLLAKRMGVLDEEACPWAFFFACYA